MCGSNGRNGPGIGLGNRVDGRDARGYGIRDSLLLFFSIGLCSRSEEVFCVGELTLMSMAGEGVAMVAVRSVAEKRMSGRGMCMVGLRALASWVGGVREKVGGLEELRRCMSERCGGETNWVEELGGRFDEKRVVVLL